MFFIYHENRSVLKLSGKSTLDFLQGLIANDIRRLSPSQSLYAVMLTSQGRFHFEFFIFLSSNSEVYLETPKAYVLELEKRLKLYSLRAEVKIEPTLLKSVTFHGDWDKVFKDLMPREGAASQESWGILSVDPRQAGMGMRSILWESLPQSILNISKEETQDIYETLRLKYCLPEVGKELMPEKTIPFDANLDDLNVLSFDKGCYLGQELIARTKYQGLVRKKLYPVHLLGLKDLEDPTLFFNEEKVGTLSSEKDSYGIAKIYTEAVRKSQSLNLPFVFKNGTEVHLRTF